MNIWHTPLNYQKKRAFSEHRMAFYFGVYKPLVILRNLQLFKSSSLSFSKE